MTTRKLGVLLAVAACGITITIASCDNNTAGPGTDVPGKNTRNDGGKGAAVQSTGLSVLPIDREASASAEFNAETQALTLTGLSGDAGITSTFGSAHSWSADVTTNFPADGGGDISYNALSGGTSVSSIQITQTAAGNEVEFAPVFTAAEVTGYNIDIYLGGNLVRRYFAALGEISRLRARLTECCDAWRRVRFINHINAGTCQWALQLNNCCQGHYTLPNGGGVVIGDEVRFTEVLAPGAYAYTSFDQISVTGNVDSYVVSGEQAFE